MADPFPILDPADPRVLDGRIWEELCDTLRDAGAHVLRPDLPATPLERAAGHRYLTQFLAAGINFCVAHADPDHPELTRMMDLNMRWGLDSPDCLYLVASLRGDARYRLWGDPGTANHLDIQVNAGHYAEGSIEALRTQGSLSGDDLQRGPDGRVEIFLGGAQRAENWLPLAVGARFVQLRQNFNDWSKERPADLWIERLGGPVSRPPLRTDQIAARIDLLRSWMREGGRLWQDMSQVMRSMPPNSVFSFAPEASAERSGLKGQAYCQGNFRCGPDEAVLFEFEPPPCRHWNISLANAYWEAIDFISRQSSLNGHQARLDPDGVFRAVIAHRDPGVPNWLDPAGHEEGTLIVRFILAEGPLPEPSARVLKLAEVRSALPDATPRVSPQAREATLRVRREALWRRYRR